MGGAPAADPTAMPTTSPVLSGMAAQPSWRAGAAPRPRDPNTHGRRSGPVRGWLEGGIGEGQTECGRDTRVTALPAGHEAQPVALLAEYVLAGHGWQTGAAPSPMPPQRAVETWAGGELKRMKIMQNENKYNKKQELRRSAPVQSNTVLRRPVSRACQTLEKPGRSKP